MVIYVNICHQYEIKQGQNISLPVDITMVVVVVVVSTMVVFVIVLCCVLMFDAVVRTDWPCSL